MMFASPLPRLSKNLLCRAQAARSGTDGVHWALALMMETEKEYQRSRLGHVKAADLPLQL